MVKQPKPRIGRPPLPKDEVLEQIAIRLHKDTIADLDEMAAALKKKRSDLIRLAVETAVDSWKPD